jgi:hypothetical protein
MKPRRGRGEFAARHRQAIRADHYRLWHLETLDFQRQNRKFAGLIFDHMSAGDR